MKGVDLILKGLSVGYSRRVLLAGLDAVFDAGTLTALVGRNGSGKSTLLRVMAGLAKPFAGEVLAGGRNAAGGLLSTPQTIVSLSPRQLARTVGFVSTERIRVTNPKVWDLVALGRTPYTDWIGNLSEQDRAAVDEALALVGMEALAGKSVETLSDGEAQRVMIARVVAQDTPVILLDEPTAFLDYVARREVCELLARLAHERGKTIVFSSHELSLVDEFADRRLTISENGNVYE
jgi:iron complex transport system ATP-binding protein